MAAAENTEPRKCLACDFETTDPVVTHCPTDGAVLPGADPLVGSVFLNKYKITDVLGRGGMGAVYKANHIFMDRPVAIKILRSELVSDSKMLRRFQLESKAVSKLKHPNVIGVYDFGLTPDAVPYLVMDYLEGRPLSTVLAEEHVLSPERCVNIFAQVCSALGHAHSKSVVHRDVKPSNIIISIEEDGLELAKIVDFGIAKVMTEDNSEAMMSLTATGEVFGSPLHMAPEQCKAGAVDGRTDIYALGTVIYECLTGKPAILGRTAMDTMIKHLSDMPLAFADARPDMHLPRKLEEAVFKSLAKEKAERFQTMEEFASALKDSLPTARVHQGDTNPLPAFVGGYDPADDTVPSTDAPGLDLYDKTQPVAVQQRQTSSGIASGAGETQPPGGLPVFTGRETLPPGELPAFTGEETQPPGGLPAFTAEETQPPGAFRLTEGAQTEPAPSVRSSLDANVETKLQGAIPPFSGEKTQPSAADPLEMRTPAAPQALEMFDLFGNPIVAQTQPLPAGDKGGDHGMVPDNDDDQDVGVKDTAYPGLQSSSELFGYDVLLPAKAEPAANLRSAITGGALGAAVSGAGGVQLKRIAQPGKRNIIIAAGAVVLLSIGGFAAKDVLFGGGSPQGKVIAPSSTPLNPTQVFDKCDPALVKLTIISSGQQVRVGDSALEDEDGNPIVVGKGDDGELSLFQNGKPVREVSSSLTVKGEKLAVAVKLRGGQPVLVLTDKSGKSMEIGRGLQLVGYTATAIGSGFFVQPNVVATNCHVVSQSGLGAAGFVGGRAEIGGRKAQFVIDKKPIIIDKEHDLALLFIPGADAPVLKLRTDFSKLNIGEPVFALGSPKGLDQSMTNGTISSRQLRGSHPGRDDGSEKLYLQHSAKIDHGNSGGPLLDAYGEVIGVNTAFMGNGTINLAVIAKYVQDLLDNADVKAKIQEMEKGGQTDLHG
jgi:serine/threonine protein kinase/S1-C subfamily serine protease